MKKALPAIVLIIFCVFTTAAEADFNHTDGLSGSPMNGGFIAHGSGNIFYQNPEDYGLYSMPVSGGAKTKIAALDGSAEWLTYDGGWIYYVLDNRIFKIREDGEEQTLLYGKDASPEYLNVSDGWLYFHSVSIPDGDAELGEYAEHFYKYVASPIYSIYKMKTDGTKLRKLGKGPGVSLTLAGEWLYYLSSLRRLVYQEFTLYRVDITGGNKEKLVQSHVNSFAIDGGVLYFSGKISAPNPNKGIYRTGLDGTVEKISDDPCEDITAKDGWIYYRAYYNIYKMRPDGSERALLTRDKGRDLCVVDGWLYYRCPAAENGGDKAAIVRIRLDGGDRQEL